FVLSQDQTLQRKSEHAHLNASTIDAVRKLPLDSPRASARPAGFRPCGAGACSWKGTSTSGAHNGHPSTPVVKHPHPRFLWETDLERNETAPGRQARAVAGRPGVRTPCSVTRGALAPPAVTPSPGASAVGSRPPRPHRTPPPTPRPPTRPPPSPRPRPNPHPNPRPRPPSPPRPTPHRRPRPPRTRGGPGLPPPSRRSRAAPALALEPLLARRLGWPVGAPAPRPSRPDARLPECGATRYTPTPLCQGLFRPSTRRPRAD